MAEKTYQELQEEAKALGLPYTGVKRVDLEASIAAAQPQENATEEETPETPAENVEETPVEEETPAEAPAEEEAPKSKSQAKREEAVKAAEEAKPKKVEIPKDTNTAIVMDNRNVVRTYSEEMHGKNFLKMAQEFVTRDVRYTIEYETREKVRRCKNCGVQLVCPNCNEAVR